MTTVTETPAAAKKLTEADHERLAAADEAANPPPPPPALDEFVIGLKPSEAQWLREASARAGIEPGQLARNLIATARSIDPQRARGGTQRREGGQ